MNEIEKQILTEEIIKGIAQAVDESLKEYLGDIGFVLITFEFNKSGLGSYISNSKREDIVKALRETADILEDKEDVPAAHKTIQ